MSWFLGQLIAKDIGLGTIAFMRRVKTVSVLLVASVALAACSSSGTSSEPELDVDGEVEVVEQEVDTALVPPTIAPGSQLALGELDSVKQELSSGCEQALAPIRDLSQTYSSGLEMNDNDRESFNAALSSGFAACDADEWERFQQLELRGWMNAVPGESP